MPGGTATGVGSLPGTDIDAALALVVETLPDLPHLPELPGRGPGADMTGRTAAALVDLHVDLQPAGWRLVERGGVDERRALDLLARDLDALVPVLPGHDGPFKVQLAGPWTLAATVDLPRGGRALGDGGAVRDLVGSLAETVAEHLADVRRRLPRAQLLLQLDEPALPAVLAGAVPTASGLGRLRAADPQAVRTGLRAVVEAAGDVPVVVHCCAAEVPVALLHDAGARAVSLDLSVARLDLDEVGERVERGLGLWAGVVPSTAPREQPDARAVAAPVHELWHRWGFPPELLGERVTFTPACGLAGAGEAWAPKALRLARDAAGMLTGAADRVER